MKKKKPNSGPSPSRKKSPGKDSERLIGFLLARDLSPSLCLDILSEALSPMVTPLFFEGQGLTTSTSNIDLTLVMKNFLAWLSNDTARGELLRLSQVSESYPKADELLVARLFLKFYRSQLSENPRLSRFRTLGDKKMTDMEILEWQAGVATVQIMDTFQETLGVLKGEERLIYQLYLEGLIPEELSALFSVPLDRLKTILSNCKKLVGAALYREVA